mmetsp:Transcript_17507/g.42475  ORF Transcript_17507/g.42475 Transcript_17507/m.42475 type:complete len:264 (+) Transcript_17507:700-1491(+)
MGNTCTCSGVRRPPAVQTRSRLPAARSCVHAGAGARGLEARAQARQAHRHPVQTVPALPGAPPVQARAARRQVGLHPAPFCPHGFNVALGLGASALRLAAPPYWRCALTLGALLLPWLRRCLCPRHGAGDGVHEPGGAEGGAGERVHHLQQLPAPRGRAPYGADRGRDAAHADAAPEPAPRTPARAGRGLREGGQSRPQRSRRGRIQGWRQESDQVQEPAGALGPRVPAGRCGVLRRYRLPQSRRLISASAAQFHPPRVSLPD